MPKPAFLAGAGAVFWSVSGSYSAANMLFLRDPKIILTWIFFLVGGRGVCVGVGVVGVGVSVGVGVGVEVSVGVGVGVEVSAGAGICLSWSLKFQKWAGGSGNPELNHT